MSRVLCLVSKVSAINLNRPLLADFSNLPPDIGRAALLPNDIAAADPPVYMILQPMGCTATSYYYERGELLPRLFTLTPVRRTCVQANEVSFGGGYSLLHGPKHCCLPVVSRHGALCCPDFPHSVATERQTILLRAAKIDKKTLIAHIQNLKSFKSPRFLIENVKIEAKINLIRLNEPIFAAEKTKNEDCVRRLRTKTNEFVRKYENTKKTKIRKYENEKRKLKNS